MMTHNLAEPLRNRLGQADEALRAANILLREESLRGSSIDPTTRCSMGR